MSRHFWNIDDLAMNGSSFALYYRKGKQRYMTNRRQSSTTNSPQK